MLKQTRFYLGLMLIVQSASAFFLAICFLFGDKKRTAKPMTLLGLLTLIGGIALMAENIKQRLDDPAIINAMNDICCEDEVIPAIPVDDTADESEFHNI